jgi:hypothetical protein
MNSHPYRYWTLADPKGATSAVELNGNPGATVYGGVTFAAIDPWGNPGAASFDGVSGEIVDPTQYNVATNTTPYSVEFFYKTVGNNATVSTGGMIELNAAAPGAVPSGTYNFTAYMSGTGGVNLHPIHMSDTGSNWYGLTDPGTTNDNQWHHAVAMFDGSSTISLYRDGVFIASAAVTTWWARALYWRLGHTFYNNAHGQSGPADWYIGSLAHVSVYNRVLLASEINSHYNAWAGTVSSPLPLPSSTPPVPLAISYIDPDGNLWMLSDRSMSQGYVCSAIAGIDGFPVMMQTIPFLDGTAVPNTYIPQPGTIGLAVLLSRPASNSENDYYALLDRFVRAFLHRRNELPKPGTLIVRRPDGTARQIAVYTSSGLDTPDVGMNDMMVYSLSLSTPDPYWSDLQPSQQMYAISVANPGILPLLPILFNSPNVIGATVINNLGNGLAWPIWTITGPGTPTLTNNTTGLSWGLSTAIPAGQQIQVTTQRGQQKAINLTTGANIWSQLTTATPRSLWPLVGGPNNVTISLPGATNASSVICQWTNRWSRA